MEQELLKVPALISKVTTMSDGGLRLQVDTQELQAKDAGEVMMLRNKIGVFVFAEKTINPEDIKDLPKVELEEGEKAPSARLRASLYVYWDKRKIEEPFDIFYRRQMEKFIETVKEKFN